jgi:hypothetical protein
MAKKHKLIHPSFPKEGTVQPSYAGSQSQVPLSLEQSSSPQSPGNLPMDYTSNMASSGEY